MAEGIKIVITTGTRTNDSNQLESKRGVYRIIPPVYLPWRTSGNSFAREVQKLGLSKAGDAALDVAMTYEEEINQGARPASPKSRIVQLINFSLGDDVSSGLVLTAGLLLSLAKRPRGIDLTVIGSGIIGKKTPFGILTTPIEIVDFLGQKLDVIKDYIAKVSDSKSDKHRYFLVLLPEKDSSGNDVKDAYENDLSEIKSLENDKCHVAIHTLDNVRSLVGTLFFGETSHLVGTENTLCRVLPASGLEIALRDPWAILRRWLKRLTISGIGFGCVGLAFYFLCSFISHFQATQLFYRNPDVSEWVPIGTKEADLIDLACDYYLRFEYKVPEVRFLNWGPFPVHVRYIYLNGTTVTLKKNLKPYKEDTYSEGYVLPGLTKENKTMTSYPAIVLVQSRVIIPFWESREDLQKDYKDYQAIFLGHKGLYMENSQVYNSQSHEKVTLNDRENYDLFTDAQTEFVSNHLIHFNANIHYRFHISNSPRWNANCPIKS